LGNAYLKNDMR